MIRSGHRAGRRSSARGCGRDNGHIPKAAGRARRQIADRLRARPACRRRRRARGGQRAPSRRRSSERHLSAAHAPADRVIPTSAATLLGTGGGVVKALPQLGDGAVLPRQFRHHLARRREAQSRAACRRRSIRRRMDALLLLAPAADSVGYVGRGDFAMLPDGRLRRRSEHEVAPFVYAGAAVLSPGAYSPMRRAARSRSTLHVRSRRRRPGACYGLRLEGVWMHVGTPGGGRGRGSDARPLRGRICVTSNLARILRKPADNRPPASLGPRAVDTTRGCETSVHMPPRVFTIPACRRRSCRTLIDALHRRRAIAAFPLR